MRGDDGKGEERKEASAIHCAVRRLWLSFSRSSPRPPRPLFPFPFFFPFPRKRLTQKAILFFEPLLLRPKTPRGFEGFAREITLHLHSRVTHLYYERERDLFQSTLLISLSVARFQAYAFHMLNYSSMKMKSYTSAG